MTQQHHSEHQHFLWCTLNKGYETMHAQSFVAMVIEGIIYLFIFFAS